MDQTFSRSIRRTFSQGDGYMLQRSTRVAVMCLTPVDGDARVYFYDGAGGQLLWELEADDSNGSKIVSFADYPLLFKNGVYVVMTDEGAQNAASLQISVVEPMSSGT